jgi:hypothetical protein
MHVLTAVSESFDFALDARSSRVSSSRGIANGTIHHDRTVGLPGLLDQSIDIDPGDAARFSLMFDQERESSQHTTDSGVGSFARCGVRNTPIGLLYDLAALVRNDAQHLRNLQVVEALHELRKQENAGNQH